MKRATRIVMALAVVLVGASCVDAGGSVPPPLELIDGGAGSSELGTPLPIELGAKGSLSVDWVQRFGGAGADLPYNAASDGNGNVYLVGRFDSPAIELGGSPLVGSGAGDIFFASFGSSGQHRWSMPFGGSAADTGRAVATHGSSVYIAGDVCSPSVNFGGGALPGPTKNDIFLAGFTEAGKYRWAKRLIGDAYELASAITFDGGGNVYLTGCFNSSQIDFGGGPVGGGSGPNYIFVASYSPDGAYRWSKQFASAHPSCAGALVTDGSGNLYVSGYLSEWMMLESATLLSVGKRDAWVASFTTSGTLRWARRFGGKDEDYIELLVTSGDGLYLAGNFEGVASFGGPQLSSAGGQDAVLARLTSGGEHVWSKRIGGPGNDFIGGLVADSGGNLAIAGLFRDTVEIDGSSLSSKGGADVLVASFSPDGARRWAMGLGGAGDEQGSGLAVGPAGHLYVAGTFRGTIDFGRGPLSSAGETDIFLLRLSAP